MRTISTEGFERPEAISPGPEPTLRWIPIADLYIDPLYHAPIAGSGLGDVQRIAQAFSWSCFAPVVVSPLEAGKFAIIDGQRRTTAAALIGLQSVPCQVVAADREQQALAHKAINRSSGSPSRMARHAAAIAASDVQAVELMDICVRAGVELLRYPVPLDRQAAGQTMAVGALTQCLRRYGKSTLITALQCVTQTSNNQPGVLSARMIKALCAVLNGDRSLCDSGLALLDAFDAIDLMALQRAASGQGASDDVSSVERIAHQIRAELRRLFPRIIGAGQSVAHVRPGAIDVTRRRSRTRADV
jgi:ParB/Sulfiredoxin domain